MRPDDAYRNGFFFACGTATLALLLFVGWKLLDATLAVATPFIGAIILSLLLEPLVRWVQARVTSGQRMRAVILVFFVFLSLFGAVMSYAGPALIGQTQRLVQFFTPVTYVITRSVGDTDRFVTVAEGVGDTTLTVKNLDNDTPYRFVVYATNADGTQFASPETATTPHRGADIAGTTKEGTAAKAVVTNADAPAASSGAATLPPQSPRDVSAHPGDGSVRLSWQPPADGLSGFDLMRKQVDKWLAGHPKIGPIKLPQNLNTITAQYSDQVSHALKVSASGLTGIIATSVGRLIDVVLVPVISIFILLDLDRLRARLYLFLPSNARRFVQVLVLDVGEVFGKYLRGLLIICSMYGGACMVYLLALSLFFPGLRVYGLLIGVLAGVLYSVPYLGAISTLLLAVIAALATGCGPTGAAFAAGGLVAINQIFDYVVMPKVVGERAGIHPILAMFSLFLGGHLIGLWGMLVAVPIAASLQGVLFRLYPKFAAPTPMTLLKNERKLEDADEAALEGETKLPDEQKAPGVPEPEARTVEPGH